MAAALVTTILFPLLPFVLLLSWIPGLVVRNGAVNAHERLHGTQAANFYLTGLLATILGFVLFGVLASAAPEAGAAWIGICLLYCLASFIVWLIALVNASSGKKFTYPVIFAIPFVKP
jgi:uncharacterized Tic20 family protein